MDNIKDLNKKELKELLFSLKFYKNVKLKLGRRGRRVFDRVYNKKSFYKIEYFPKMKKDDVWNESNKAFKKFFGIYLKKDEVSFVENKKLLGGIIIFKDNQIIDLSFSKIKKELV